MIRVLAAVSLCAALVACASRPPAANPPVPVKVDAAQHYSGTWLEIGRRPMWFTDGCVAGWTTYTRGPGAGEVAIVDGCRKKTPDGKPRTISGKGRITDPGTDARLHVKYLGGVVSRDYWVLAQGPEEGGWFISADGALHDLYIYTRRVPSAAHRAVLTGKAAALGYDVSKLEFPAH